MTASRTPRWTTTGRPLLAAALALALMAVLLPAASAQSPSNSTSAATPEYPDVNRSSVHRDNIRALAERGIVQGRTDGAFLPAQGLTRGQLASVLARAGELEPVTPSRFPDAVGTTHEGAIEALADLDVIRGFEDGTFGPNMTIRRDQVAAMISRWMDLTPDADGPFTDITGNVHAGDINALYEIGVVNGTTATTFAPSLTLRRDQASSIVARALSVGEGTVRIKLLATNDFHGRLVPPSINLVPEGGDEAVPVGGAAYLSTHLDQVRVGNPNNLTVDAGDLVGATPVLSNLFLDEPSVRAANLWGLDIQTVGNHEFDRGQEEVIRRLEGGCAPDGCFDDDRPFEGSNFGTLSTNVITDDGDALTAPYRIIVSGEVSIGFLGVTTVNTPNVVSPTGIQGLTFLPEAEAVNTWIPELQERDVDAIVVLMHEGGRQDGTYNQCENFRGAASEIIDDFDDAVDVVVTAHTHEQYVCDVDGKLVTSANEYGTMFTEIDLTVSLDGQGVVRHGATNHLVTRDVEPAADMVELIEYYEELSGPELEAVVGTSEVAIPRTTREAESAQGNLATDALLDQYDVDFAFQNSGGLRADLTADDDRDGSAYNIRRRNILEVWPFGNIVALAEVDGPTLQAILDNGVYEVGGGRFIQLAGLRIEYSIDESVALEDNGGFPRGVIESVEYWQHATEADGTPVDLGSDQSYRIALNDFMSVGGDNYPDIEDDVYSLQDPLEVAVERYLEGNSPVNPEVEGRIVQLD